MIRTVAASFGAVLRAYLDPALLACFVLAWLPAFALLLLPGPADPAEAFGLLVRWLAPLLLAPALVAAWRLRSAWPALGPEDPGLVWLHGLGVAAWQCRLGALLASLTALLLLSGVTLTLLLCWLGAAPNRPALHEAVRLHPMPPREDPSAGPRALLARPGDHEDFELPGAAGPAGLLLRPLWLLGERQATEILLGLGPRDGGPAIELGTVRIPDVGREAWLALPAEAAVGGRLRAIRQTGPGSRLSLVLGELWRLGPGLSPAPAALALILAGLPLALCLLGGSWLLSLVLGPALQRLGLLFLAPSLWLLLPSPLAGLAQARIPAGTEVLPWAVPLTVALILAVTLPRPLRPAEDQP